MGTLLSCLCAGSQPPYDRLTLIYAAAVELSGETSFPSTACVAAQPPLRRLGYIYAVFREISGDTSLPSQECVEAEPYADQVSRIYEAVFAYAADDALADVRCVRGRPIWQQFLEVYRALYVAAGSPDELTDPRCVQVQSSLDILTHVYCSLLYLIENANPIVLSATVDESGNNIEITFNQNVTGQVLFDITIDGVPFNIDYDSGEGGSVYSYIIDGHTVVSGEVVLLNYSPGNIVSVSTGNPLEAFVDFPVTNPFDVDLRVTSDGDTRVTSDADNRVTA